MTVRSATDALTLAVFVLLLLLAVITGYTLGNTPPPPAPLAFCGTDVTPHGGNDSLYLAGKKLWNANGCGACHAKSMKYDATGPALAGVTDRWAAYPREDLYAWIRNNGKLRASGHPRAIEVYKEWNGAAMNNYQGLTDGEVAAILEYIEGAGGK